MGISPKQLEQLQRRLSAPRSASSPDADADPGAIAFSSSVIVGIDPSLRGTGYGVIAPTADGSRALDHGTIRCPAVWSRSRCLAEIAGTIRSVIARHSPAVCAVEGLFHAQNLRTALIMGEARGAALATVAESLIPIFELAPRRAKLAIVGYGAAQKSAVAKMVQRILALPEPPAPDAADALALALALAESRAISGPSAPKRV